VGEKVADCVLLYSCGYREAFPVDVWVRRAMERYYSQAGSTVKDIRAFADRKFGKLAGLAQQYLFYYERHLKHI
jgi:N-glycosylase/DNA lyase